MSAVLYGNCDTCGLAYTVEEFDHNYVVEVAGRAVSECPFCGADLPSPSLTLPQIDLRSASVDLGEEGS